MEFGVFFETARLEYLEVIYSPETVRRSDECRRVSHCHTQATIDLVEDGLSDLISFLLPVQNRHLETVVISMTIRNTT
jgi:hypothetical protein